MQTFAQLKSRLREELWPQGEAQNLVTAHDKAFVEVLIDLQRWNNCFQYNNVSVFNPCSILFQCGMSVISAPRGSIFRVSTFDRINSETCEEDADVPVNWCSEVIYQNVPYDRLKKMVDQILCEHCSPLSLPTSCGYPTPSNAAYHGFPELPLGFQYPQASLDRTCQPLVGCATPRSRVGVWAFNNGRLYLAPWLQSTEVATVQWNGIRRTWADSDLVSDDADYELAVKEYVWWQHYKDYERDAAQAAQHQAAYYDIRAELIRDCREQTRDHRGEPSLASQSLTTLMGQSTGVIAGVATPQDLTITDVSETEVTLNWADVSGCTVTFIIERSTDGETWTEIATTAACVTEYTDTDLTPLTQYYYRITATDGTSDSQPTPAVSTTTGGTTSTTTTTAPPPSTLINVAFLFAGPTSKTGAAAVGQTGDQWNSFDASVGMGYLDLDYADGAASGARLQDVGSPGGSYGTNGNSDAMLNRFLVKNTFPYTKQFVVSDLPAGVYDLYLYGWSNQAGSFTTGGCTVQNAAGHWIASIIGVGPIITGTKIVATNDNPPFVETTGEYPATCPSGGNFSRIAGFAVAAGQNLSIQCTNPESGFYGVISGFQLVKVG